MDERERLIEIMKSQELNSKQLSLELGVSAGTISNILGGRNKPSLEFLQNVANHFPFISPTWLFLGFGEKYIDGYVPTTPSKADQDLFSQAPTSSPLAEMIRPHALEGTTSVVAQRNQLKNSSSASEEIKSNARTVQKIVIFYSDGTFEER
jgi:transcriptional regulator with XRE-family HTH domain